MKNIYHSSQHSFHIPVMGLAYTIDSPVKVARYGISSVISIMEDRLVEMMRKYYYQSTGREYIPIPTNEDDYRAKRITDYLNLVSIIVEEQLEKLRRASFEAGSEITKYFEMLPDACDLKNLFRKMLHTNNEARKEELATYLRTQIQAGSIDVNIMTKTDRDHYKHGKLSEEGSDALSALRGYAKSRLSNSSVIFSAGLNPRLFNYLGNCKEFDVNEDGAFTKKVVIKVSDYRSALIQGKYLAKKGIWVSEFRIESGLNCGGHAFATEGYLLGPILEEFKLKRKELVETLFEIYNATLKQRGNHFFVYPPALKISVQGGIGTYEEDEFLHNFYNIESTGWGTPFLLVPEATTVDEATLQLLSNATEKDVVLSRNSPLGVRFHYLKGTSSEKEKNLRIANGKPGSPCTEKHLAFNTEFTTEPICTASRKYQKLKLAQIESLDLPAAEYQKQVTEVLDKECLCIGLSNAAAINYSQSFIKNLSAVTICPGPNIANFSKVVSLKTMVDHIYGRIDILTNHKRANMFMAELNLYINYLVEQFENENPESILKKKKYFTSFYQNLKNGIEYYLEMAELITRDTSRFICSLNEAGHRLDAIFEINTISPVPGICN